MADNFLFDFSDGGSLDRLAARVRAFQQQINDANRSLEARGVSAAPLREFQERFNAVLGGHITRINELTASVTRLDAALKGSQGKSTITDPTTGALLGGRQTIQGQADAARQELAARTLAVSDLLNSSEAQHAALLREQLGLQESLVQLVARRQALAQESSPETVRARLQEVAEARLNALVERRRELLAQVAEQRARIEQTTPRNVGQQAFEDEKRAAEEILKLRARLVQFEQQRNQILAAREARDLAQTKAVGPRSPQEEEALIKAQTAAKEDLKRVDDQILDVERELLEQQRRREAAAGRIAALERAGSTPANIGELLNRLQGVNEGIEALELAPLQELSRLAGFDVAEAFERLNIKARELAAANLAPEDEAVQLRELNEEARRLANTVGQLAGKQIPPLFDPSQLFAGLPLFERTVIGAFQGIGQRFRATLQFALSGALLFQLQRLGREFVQAAIEVERSFADIGTAFEFDLALEDPNITRGTVEFDRRLESVRRRLVDVADELQALPTEVNAAAYEMVSRFSDVEAIMIATNAQILATKVSTIDQSEALNALTATAESYGQTLNAELVGKERQIALAQIYARALDGAVAIQQQYTTSVEETIEGTAALAELFAQQGFSLAQTQAALSLVIQRTGVTGATAADRIGRAISQLTSPETRSELVGLASTIDGFNLTLLDFGSGEQALSRINEELERLAQVDPSAAQDLQNRLAQIIGQRRETAFIAPLLGTAQLQKEVAGVVEGSAGQALDRQAVLARTMSEILQSIIGQFQELAQNLERLGLFSPFKAILAGADATLNFVNELIKKLSTVFDFFDRISFGDTGLGDLIKTVLSVAIGFTALTRAVDVANVAIEALTRFKQLAAATSVGKVVAESLATGRAGGVVSSQTIAAGATAGAFANARALSLAEKGTLTFGKTLKAFFIAPVGTANFVVARLYQGLIALAAGMTAVTGAAGQAAVAEVSLAQVRASATFGGVAARLGQAVVAVGLGIARFVGSMFILLEVLALLKGAFDALAAAPAAIEGLDPTLASNREKRREELKSEQAITGKPLSDRQAEIQISQEAIDTLEEERKNFDTFTGAATSFFLTVIGLGNRSTAAAGGAALAEQKEKWRLIGLQIQEYTDALNFLVNQEGLTPEEIVALQAQIAQFQTLAATIQQLNRSGIAGRVTSGTRDPATYINDERQFNEAVAAFQEFATGFTEDFGINLNNAVEGAVDQIRKDLTRIQEESQAGDLSFGAAISEAAAKLANAEALLRQNEDPEQREELETLVRDSKRTVKELIDQEARFMERLLLLTADTPVEQAAAKLEAAKQALGRAADQFAANSGAIKQKRLELFEAEKAYTDAIADEARARLELEASNAKTFSAQLAALSALKAAIIRQAIERVGAIEFYTKGEAAFTLEELEAYIGFVDTERNIRLRATQLQAKLSILERASTQDNIAAIAAQIASIQAEVAFLRKEGAEELVIREKLQEIRNAQANLLLAQADRRAAFFNLTAGVGDKIAAAQATLRGALDRLKTLTDLGAGETQAGYEAQLDVLRARAALADLALQQADLERRLASDLTNSLEQALLDVVTAQQALAAATGPLEKLEAEKALIDAQNNAQREFYDQRIADLDFLFQTDQIGQSQYVAALRSLQSGIDRTTRQGEELWREIELQIRGLLESAENLAFNIPTEIQLPTLFEVRRALAADALGVNYQDNRTQEINLYVSDNVDVNTVIAALEQRFGSQIDLEASRLTAGSAGITIGGF